MGRIDHRLRILLIIGGIGGVHNQSQPIGMQLAIETCPKLFKLALLYLCGPFQINKYSRISKAKKPPPQTFTFSLLPEICALKDLIGRTGYKTAEDATILIGIPEGKFIVTSRDGMHSVCEADFHAVRQGA